MSPAARSTLMLLALVVACHADPTAWPARPAVYPAFSVVGGEAWAGGEVTLRMRGPGEHPATATLVLLYNIRVPLTPRDDSTMTGVVPSQAVGGMQHARLEIGAFDTVLNPIRVAGTYGQSTLLLDLAQGHLYGAAYRPGSGQFLFGDQHAVGAVSHISVEPDLLGVAAHRMTAPGPTPDPDVWLLRSTPNGPLERWRLGDTPLLLETLPYTGNGPWQTVAELGPDRLLTIDGNGGQLLRRAGGGVLGDGGAYLTERRLQFTGLNRVVMSPRGDRAAMTAFSGMVDPDLPSATPGIPVFRMPEATVAYQFDADKAVTAVDFSPDGTLLAAAVGPDHLNAVSIQLRDATTGAVQRHIHGDRRVYRGLAFDPHRPLLYAVAVANKNAGELPAFELEVYSTSDWTLRGRFAGHCLLGCTREVLIVVDPYLGLYTIETSVGTSDEKLVVHRYRVN